jgi:hypothetical protein
MGEADKQRKRAAKAAAKAAEENKTEQPQKKPGGMGWRRGTGRQVVPTGRGRPASESCRRKKAHARHMHTMNGTRYECPGIAE